MKLNKEYNKEKPYTGRSKRSEWGVVGMLGKLIVDDDGMCEVDDFCSVGANGIATKGNQYIVLERLDESHIKILFR